MLFSVFLQFPTRHSFALLQHCILCLAFPSTYQILQKHFQGPYHCRDNFYISQFPQSSDLFFQILVLFHFFFLFLSTVTSAGTAISIIIPFCSFLSITTRSGRLAFIRLSHWIFMSHSTLISSFSTATFRACSYHFSLCSNLFFLQISQ